ncbi:unnamed protein product [Amoebophrya sp. A25]|nr:unnamed protein product [Amoebophrya sp. A25]|eukprot:GSA25T00007088001.1
MTSEETNGHQPDAAGAKPEIQRGGLISEKQAAVQVEWAEKDTSEVMLSAETWDSLQLSKELMDGIYAMNYVRPSKIQAAALPLICPPKSLNMIGQAANGSGKTATFSLGMLSQIDPALKAPQAMVVAPTRELAIQTEEVLTSLGKFMGIKVRKVLPQEEHMEKGKCEAHVVVGTPGKVFDLVKKRILNVDRVKVFVLDEADVMLNEENTGMGAQVAGVRKFLPKNIQVLFFSATFPEKVLDLANKTVGANAAKITVKNDNLVPETILNFHQFTTSPAEKFEALKELYAHLNIGQSIIFVNSRDSALDVSTKMKAEGYSVSMITGGGSGGKGKGKGDKGHAENFVDPKERDIRMDEFRRGITKVLVATDVLARGIDVPAVTLVVNYELPFNRNGPGANGETFVQRIGRTGRFGMKGLAVSLVDNREKPQLLDLTKEFNIKNMTDLDGDYELLEERLKQSRKAKAAGAAGDAQQVQ